MSFAKTTDRARWAVTACLVAFTTFLAGCVAPIGADRVTVREAYDQVDSSVLRDGRLSSGTESVLHRYALGATATEDPAEAVRRLHRTALATGDRDLLYSLAELCYVAAEEIHQSVKPWEVRDPREYYLGATVYAWLYLFGTNGPPPSAFDRRFRDACDLYNFSLGLALAGDREGDTGVRLADGERRLPVGGITVRVNQAEFPGPLDEFEEIVAADWFRVHGLSRRNREPGMGAPLVCIRKMQPELQLRPAVPVTVLLRGPESLGQLEIGGGVCSLELYPAHGRSVVTIGGRSVPLEVDLTTHRAVTLNQSRVWNLGRLDFLAPSEHVRNQLMLNQPFEPDLIPVVFVHGTFSSPVTWAEMANAITGDPVLRRRYQVWSFIYGSGNPLVQSVSDLRAALTAEMERRDPQGTNAALRQMVLIGHSQGGLLVKGTAVDSGDRIWRVFSTNRLEDLKVSEARREELRRWLFLTPLPFVKRVVFIATPHRGSYRLSSFARRLARRLVKLPGELVARGADIMKATDGSQFGNFFSGQLPTSLDGMSPSNPGLLALSEIPVDPAIRAHSIIAVEGHGEFRKGRDGIVSYESAHQDGVESEFIVRSYHTCLDDPATVEEVCRILLEHLGTAGPAPVRGADAK